MCRKDSDLRKNGLTEPSTRSVCADGSKGHRGRVTDHALACRNLHVVNATEALKMEEVGGGRLCVAGGADHRLRRLVRQVGNALELDWKITTLQETAREWARSGEMSFTVETGKNGKQVDIRERHRVVRETSELYSTSVRSIAMG